MKRSDRTEREAAALRANLLKRKEQMRRRAAAKTAEGDQPEAESPAPDTEAGDAAPPRG